MTVRNLQPTMFIGTAAELSTLNPTLTASAFAVATDTGAVTFGPGVLANLTPSGTTAFAPIPYRDTAANLASDNPVLAAGRVGLATDTNVLAMGDGSTAWNSLSKFRPTATPQIKRSTTQQTGIGGTITDLTGLTGLQFTVGAQPWVVELSCPYVTSSAADHVAMLYLRTSADVNVAQMPVNTGSSSVQAAPILRVVIETPGSYNYKAGIQKSVGAGTVGNGANLATLEAVLTARPMVP